MAVAESTILQLIAAAREQAADILVQARNEINIAMGAALGLGANDVAIAIPAFPIEPPPSGDPGEVPVFTGGGFSDPGLNAIQPVLTALPTSFDASGEPGVQPTLQIAPALDLATGAPGAAPTLTPVPVLNIEGEPETVADLAELQRLDLSGAPGTVPSVAGFIDPGGQPTGAPGDVTLIQGVPDVNFSIDLPTAPDLVAEIRGITAPPITAITIPTAPTYQPPPFTGVSPLDPGSAPTNLDGTMRSEFSGVSAIMRSAIASDLDGVIARYCPLYASAMSKIETRLATYLDGGSALSTTVQDAIHARALSKSDAEYRRSRTRISEEAGAMGHSMPGPMFYAQLRENDNLRRDTNAAAARDLMIKLADMEQANLQFAVKQSSDLRVSMLNAAISYCGTTVQINGQAVQYAREVVGALVQNYDVAVKRSEIQCRIYEAEVRKYEGLLKGAMAILEAYQAQVRGLEAQANVDTAMVNAYKARIDAVQAEAAVYRAQVDGAVARSSLERLKVEIYQARVQAFTAQTNAWSAQWTGYKAAVDGRIAVVQASVEQVKGFTAQSENYRAIIQARSMAIDAVAKNNEAKQKQVASAVEVYKVKLDARNTQIDGIARTNEALLRQFLATVEAWKTRIQAQATASESVGRSNESASRQYQSATQAFEAVLRARSLLIESIARTNEANQRQFTSAVEAYRARVGALTDVNKAEIASFDATLDSFRAKANAISERSRADIARYTAAYQAVVSSADLYLRRQHEQHDLQIHRVASMAQLATAAASNYAGTAQAALSGLNSFVGLADSTQ